MPLCISCAVYLPHLYTIYDSADNLRLEVCPSCSSFADPYVEHDTLVVLLDLILLKAGAYRHLLFNRGSSPRREGRPVVQVDEHELAMARWRTVFKLAVPMIIVDSYVRWTQLALDTDDTKTPLSLANDAETLARVFVGCALETVAFHVGVITACVLVLLLTDSWYTLRRKTRPKSGIRREFHVSLVPLTLIYSSVTKLFLLLMLSIWRVSPPKPSAALTLNTYERTLKLFDEDSLDRTWVVRNILGGMAAGFGLRVILDCHPTLTMLVVLAGWTVKTAIASVMGAWVAGSGRSRVAETWLAYSIP